MSAVQNGRGRVGTVSHGHLRVCCVYFVMLSLFLFYFSLSGKKLMCMDVFV